MTRQLHERIARDEDRTVSGSTVRLWVEFSVLFVIAPAIVAVFLPSDWMFPALFAVTAAGLVLLAMTPGFRWRSLLSGSVPLMPVVGVGVATFLFGLLAVRLWAPGAEFFLVRNQPSLMIMILCLYPILSALPQELVFRPLFFRRYGTIIPGGRAGLWLNAAIFAFAHLMYWNALVLVMTFVGGYIFARAYEVRGSFPLAVVLHAVAGNIIFLVGLGVFFYSGNVTRPF